MGNRTVLAAAALFLGLFVAVSLGLGLIFGLIGRSDPSDWQELSDFDQISFSAVGEMQVMLGPSAAITVDGRPRDLDRLRVFVRDETLHVEYRPGPLGFLRPPLGRIRYHVTLPTLEGLELSGAGRVDVEGVNTASFRLAVSGLGTVAVADLQADRVEVDFSGGGRAELAGAAADQSVSISGAGFYAAGDLRTETARVRVSGAGTAEVWVSDALDIDISGLGSVRHYGAAVVTQSISGLGSVEALGRKEK